MAEVRNKLGITTRSALVVLFKIGSRKGDNFTANNDVVCVSSEKINCVRRNFIKLMFFDYNKKKDIWCLLNKGKRSNNSVHSTEVYKLLVSKYNNNPAKQHVSDFIDGYLSENNIVLKKYIQQYTMEWRQIADEYHKRAEMVFNTTLPDNITAYLTINNRNPYNIKENLFFVTVPRKTILKTAMHELWHFYTWYGLGADQKDKLGKKNYNDLKEALTVLLNEECADLMPEGDSDMGYPQHQHLRKEIQELWNKEKDIHNVWGKMAKKYE